jgi:hypothetical protein
LEKRLQGFTLAGEGGLDGEEQDFQVEQEGHVVDVGEVIAEFMLDGGVIEAVDLRQSGHAGANRFAQAVGGNASGEFFGKEGAFGTGSDEAHFTFENIDQLGEFIQMPAAQEAPNAGDPGIVLTGEDGSGLLFRIMVHRAEFVEGEFSAALSDPSLAIERGSSAGPADKQGDEQQER